MCLLSLVDPAYWIKSSGSADGAESSTRVDIELRRNSMSMHSFASHYRFVDRRNKFGYVSVTCLLFCVHGRVFLIKGKVLCITLVFTVFLSFYIFAFSLYLPEDVL